MKIHALFVVLILGALAGCSSVVAPAQNGPLVSADIANVKESDLLYVAAEQYEVMVFAYHDGVIGQQVGLLENFRYPRGMCTENDGAVWITDQYQGRVTKYAHGGTQPIETIVEGGFSANDCAVDPVTGNLAVSNAHRESGAIRIYPPRAHKATVFKFSYFQPTSLAYDSAGNLVVTGGRGELYELPYRGSQFENLSVSGGTLNGVSGIQWGNPNFLIGTSGNDGPVVDKLKVSYGVARIVGTIPLAGTVQSQYPALRSGNLVVPDDAGDIVRVYSLSNGKIVSSISNLDRPWSAVVSQPPPK